MSRRVFWIATAALALLVTLASLAHVAWPQLPIEGDPFGCWWGYAQRLSEGRLRAALLAADTSGRFVGYPLWIAFFLKIPGLSFLHALTLTRLSSVVLSVVGMWLLLRELGLRDRLYRLVCLLFVHASPIYLSVIVTNTPDSLKAGAFLLSAAYFFRARQTAEQRPYRLYLLWAFFLISLRSIEFFSIGALGGVAALSAGSVKGFWQNVRRFVLPLMGWAVFLHFVGRTMLGHWGFSGPGNKAHTWYGLYLGSLKEIADQGAPLSQILWAAAKWPVVQLANKLVYFIQDYIFQFSFMRYELFPNFVKDPVLPPGSPGPWWAMLVLALFLLAGAGAMCWRNDRKFARPGTLLLVSGLFPLAFWTFGQQHYEPRYWVLIFLPLFLGALSYFPGRGTRPFVTLAAAAVLLLACQRPHLLEKRRVHEQSLAVLPEWQSVVTAHCSPDEAISLPYGAYRWSSFRYFAAEWCPELEVVMETENPNGKRLTRYEPKIFIK